MGAIAPILLLDYISRPPLSQNPPSAPDYLIKHTGHEVKENDHQMICLLCLIKFAQEVKEHVENTEKKTHVDTGASGWIDLGFHCEEKTSETFIPIAFFLD